MLLAVLLAQSIYEWKAEFYFFIYEWKAGVFLLPSHFEPYDVLALLSSTRKV